MLWDTSSKSDKLYFIAVIMSNSLLDSIENPELLSRLVINRLLWYDII